MSIRKKMAAFVAACMMLLALPAMAFAYNGVSVGTSFVGAEGHPTLTVDATFATNDLAKDAQADTETLTLAYTGVEKLDGAFAVTDKNVTGIDKEHAKTFTTMEESAISGDKLTYNIAWNDLFSDISFTAPGYYNFTLTAAGNNVNLDYANAKANALNIKVAVTKNADKPTELVIYDVFVSDADGKKIAKNASIAIPSNAGDDFVLSKTVKGAYADEKQAFTFTVEIAGAKGHYGYHLVGNNADITPKEVNNINVTSSGTSTFTVTLHHGQSLRILDLPKGATVTVTETGVAGYLPSYTDSATHTEAVKGTLNNNLKTDALTIVSEKQNTVSFLNTKDKSTDPENPLPTGLMMEVAPYVAIALAAIAGAILFVVARRRRRESDEF